MATQEDDLAGYVYFQAGPDVSEGYIDFVAVAETARERGQLARNWSLLQPTAHLAGPTSSLVRLTVNTSMPRRCGSMNGWGSSASER